MYAVISHNPADEGTEFVEGNIRVGSNTIGVPISLLKSVFWLTGDEHTGEDCVIELVDALSKQASRKFGTQLFTEVSDDGR